MEGREVLSLKTGPPGGGRARWLRRCPARCLSPERTACSSAWPIRGVSGLRWKWEVGTDRVNIYGCKYWCAPSRTGDTKGFLIVLRHTFPSHAVGESLHY